MKWDEFRRPLPRFQFAGKIVRMKTLATAIGLFLATPSVVVAAPRNGGNSIACMSISACLSSDPCTNAIADNGALVSTLIWYLDNC